VVVLEELKERLNSANKLTGYIGYEPSGLLHIGSLIWAQKVKDLTEAGVDMRILEATWHAWINDKVGGDLERIKTVARYTREVLEAFGLEISKIKFIDAEELVQDKDYWALVLRVAKNTPLARMRRALTIMGRKEEDAALDTSKLIYPAMQVADIIYMDLDIALGGSDQRKAHMLARDVAEKMKAKKVIALHTPLLTGLSGGPRMSSSEEDEGMDYKMSKSKPEDAIFVHDSEEDIQRKLTKAYCPKSQVEGNPVLEINKYILLPHFGELKIERAQKYGGDLVIKDYGELERIYSKGELHPLDLKRATAIKLNELLEPIRKKLEDRSEMKLLIKEIGANVSR